jgi:hypothetical protein
MKMIRIPLPPALLAVILTAGLIAGSHPMAWAQDAAPEKGPFTEKQQRLAAVNSLWRLKNAIEKDGFYSARVALNVWRSNAIDAGTFDPDEYQEYKRQIYEKSIKENLRCYEAALQSEDYTNARICLHSWKTHSLEIDEFDPVHFEEMQRRLK